MCNLTPEGMTVLRVYRNDSTLILKNSLWGYSPVLWMYTNWSTLNIILSMFSLTMVWLANTLSEVFEISVVAQLECGEKEDFDIC